MELLLPLRPDLCLPGPEREYETPRPRISDHPAQQNSGLIVGPRTSDYYRVSCGRMIAELDTVALTVNLPNHGLTAGDVGAVVHVYKGGKRFLVEFTTFDGSTVAVTKVADTQIRPLSRNEIHHARRFEPVAR